MIPCDFKVDSPTLILGAAWTEDRTVGELSQHGRIVHEQAAVSATEEILLTSAHGLDEARA